MNTDTHRLELNKITEKIIGCAFTVSNTLGAGFFEKVYENALVHELRRSGLRVEQQVSVKIYYDDIIAGDYVADILVEENILVELKAVQKLDDVQVAQCLNYLKGAGLHICLLINFGVPKVEIKRIVL